MKKAGFTKEEMKYLASLDAVEEVTRKQIIYTHSFKQSFLDQYSAGKSPKVIFEEAGLFASLIGYKRIERACARWRESEKKGTLKTPARKRISRDTLRAQERALARERIAKIHTRYEMQIDALKESFQRKLERKEKHLKRESALREEKKDKLIQDLLEQVELLKVPGASSDSKERATKRIPKTEAFKQIARKKADGSIKNVRLACKILGVSPSGYYKWLRSASKRQEKDARDERDFALIEKAYTFGGFKKGAKPIKVILQREFGVCMNLKKIRRLMNKYGISGPMKLANPYKHSKVDVEGKPIVGENLLDRNFFPDKLRYALATDISYLRLNTGKFCYLAVVIDMQNQEVLGYKLSQSLKMPLVLDTLKQLEGIELAPNALIHSDQGAHYTSRAYRNAIKDLGLCFSMSRRATCLDNACVESFFGHMKREMGSTKDMSFEEVEQCISQYIDYWNNVRPKERLGFKTPSEYAKELAG